MSFIRFPHFTGPFTNSIKVIKYINLKYLRLVLEFALHVIWPFDCRLAVRMLATYPRRWPKVGDLLATGTDRLVTLARSCKRKCAKEYRVEYVNRKFRAR
jgi:hypothetical protein